MSTLPRTQHIIASGVIAAVGVSVAYISFTQQPSEAFVFPRLISSVFAVLALWTFVKAILGRTKVGNGLSPEAMKNLLPGVAIAIFYAFWAAKALGFYTATALTVFVLVSMYDPAPHSSGTTWIKRIAISAGFTAVLYGLFAMLLNVFTPREIFL